MSSSIRSVETVVDDHKNQINVNKKIIIENDRALYGDGHREISLNYRSCSYSSVDSRIYNQFFKEAQEALVRSGFSTEKHALAMKKIFTLCFHRIEDKARNIQKMIWSNRD